MMKHILLLSTCLGVQLFAGTFQKNFSMVPKTEPSCHAQGKALTEEFRAQTGNQTGNVVCTEEGKAQASFLLTYDAPEKLKQVSTANVVTAYPLNLYSSQEKCEAAISAQTQLFETATGLKPFLSYCINNKWDARSWRPYILGFGESLVQYHVVGYYYFSSPHKFDAASYVKTVRARLAEVGASLAGVNSIPSLGYGAMTIHYYGPRKLNFELVEYTKNIRLEECQTNRVRFGDYSQVQAKNPVMSYCGSVSVGGGWELTVLFMNEAPIQKRFSVESFRTFEECDAQRERLLTFYHDQVDGNIFGAFCSHDDSKIKLLLISSTH